MTEYVNRGIKDTKGTLAELCKKCVTDMGQNDIQLHSNINSPTRVCILPPWKHAHMKTRYNQVIRMTVKICIKEI